MGARENECQITQNYILHTKFLEFYLYNHNSCEIWHFIFPNFHEKFFWCYHRWFITSLALEKCKKECNILWIILVQDFCPLKIKVIQFPDGVCLNNSLKTIVQQQNSVFYWKWSAVINLSRSFISLQKCGYRIVNSYCCIQFHAVELDQKSKSMLLQLNSLWSGKKHWRRNLIADVLTGDKILTTHPHQLSLFFSLNCWLDVH